LTNREYFIHGNSPQPFFTPLEDRRRVLTQALGDARAGSILIFSQA